jgi:LytS/YehU family sensor histidine kinase
VHLPSLLFQPFVKVALGHTVWNIVDVVDICIRVPQSEAGTRVSGEQVPAATKEREYERT